MEVIEVLLVLLGRVFLVCEGEITVDGEPGTVESARDPAIYDINLNDPKSC